MFFVRLSNSRLASHGVCPHDIWEVGLYCGFSLHPQGKQHQPQRQKENRKRLIEDIIQNKSLIVSSCPRITAEWIPFPGQGLPPCIALLLELKFNFAAKGLASTQAGRLPAGVLGTKKYKIFRLQLNAHFSPSDFDISSTGWQNTKQKLAF